jgi:hypothetical protein
MAKTAKNTVEESSNEPKTNPAPAPTQGVPAGIPKPAAKFSLDRFKSKRDPEIAGVETLLTALPCHKIAHANDYVRLHHDVENYWSDELCFVTVPIKGMKDGKLHLISEEIALKYLPSKRVQRMRLALACNADGELFLCQVPTRNLDNKFNAKAQEACELAKEKWLEVVSRKAEGHDDYQITFAKDQDAFTAPDWPKQTSLDELISVTFADRQITEEDHPALLRLIGSKQKIS